MAETENLAQDYLDEDPATLTEKQLRDIAILFNLPLSTIKKLAKEMTKARQNIDPSELAPEQ